MASALSAFWPTPAALVMTAAIWSDSSLPSGSVWIRMVSSPEVLTIGDAASGMSSVSAARATALRMFSTVASVIFPDDTETWYSTPPWNSMP